MMRVLALLLLVAVGLAVGGHKRTCKGTSNRLKMPSNIHLHYADLRARYTNCTHVDGSLELTYLFGRSLDLTFLGDVQEVSGYLLITHVDVEILKLPSLKTIRGTSLLELSSFSQQFGVYVAHCKISEFELPALRKIGAGAVGIYG